MNPKVKGYELFLNSQAAATANNNTSKDTKDTEEQLEIVMDELDQLKKLSSGRFITNDATIEKLADLIENNSRCFMIILDELVSLFANFKKKGREGDRTFYLTGYNGNDSHTVDRVSRGEMFIPLLSTSLIGGIQDDKLKKYVTETLDGNNDGFLQRFLLFVWPDKPHVYEFIDEEVDETLTTNMQTIFDKLEKINLSTFGITPIKGKLLGLHFNNKAQPRFQKWSEGLQNRIANKFGNKPAFQAHLGKYQKLCSALALIFQLLEVGTEPDEVEPCAEIGLPHLELATKWCDYLEEHARKLYSMEINDELISALALRDKIEDREVADKMKVRDIYQHHWGNLGGKEEVSKAIDVLESYNWVKRETIKPSKGKGRHSEVIRIHPDFRD